MQCYQDSFFLIYTRTKSTALGSVWHVIICQRSNLESLPRSKISLYIPLCIRWHCKRQSWQWLWYFLLLCLRHPTVLAKALCFWLSICCVCPFIRTDLVTTISQ